MFKKVIYALAITTAMAILAFGGLSIWSQRPLDKAAALDHLEQYFDKASKPKAAFSGVQARIESKGKDISFEYANGNSLRQEGLSLDQPFHAASIGKLFTATVIYQLAEEGKLSLEDPLTKYIEPHRFGDLFVFDGVDYADKVTIQQLLSHTSGTPDYFVDAATSGKDIKTWMKEGPDRIWTPDDLLNFSVNQQKALGIPGEHYNYTDTGYILLGLIIEALDHDTFDNILAKRIFGPLNMTNTYMPERSKPMAKDTKPLADLWLYGKEMGDTLSVSVDWSGGGVASTMADLLKFSEALHGKKLISENSLALMFTKSNRFAGGIYTGNGGMVIHFKDFFPLLDLPVVMGHSGFISTHLYYEPISDTHIVMNFGSEAKMQDSVKALIEIMNTLNRVK